MSNEPCGTNYAYIIFPFRRHFSFSLRFYFIPFRAAASALRAAEHPNDLFVESIVRGSFTLSRSLLSPSPSSARRANTASRYASTPQSNVQTFSVTSLLTSSQRMSSAFSLCLRHHLYYRRRCRQSVW